MKIVYQYIFMYLNYNQLSIPNIRNDFRIIKDEVYSRIIEPALDMILLPRKTPSQIEEEKVERNAYGEVLDTQVKEFYREQLAIFIVDKLVKNVYIYYYLLLIDYKTSC